MPEKWISMDIECDGGCGLVPFRYRDRNFVNALQWAIGLELFLLGKDPWQVVLQSDAVPIRQRDSAVPQRLADVLDTALIDRPEIQFKTVAAFRQALNEVL